MKEVKTELLKILTKKRLITITVIWIIGILLKIMADTDLFTESVLQIKPIDYFFSMIIILALHLFFWTNKSSNSH